jgi:hypothetical protein
MWTLARPVRVRLVAILVTVSLNLAEPLSLRELRQFVETAERNRADAAADLREYDENNELVGLAAVGQADDEADEDVEDVEDDESAGSDDEDVDATQGAESDADEGDTDGANRP